MKTKIFICDCKDLSKGTKDCNNRKEHDNKFRLDREKKDALKIPKDFPVKPLISKAAVFRAERAATCNTCGRIWDDGISTSMTPVPSGRCPFEAFHVDEIESMDDIHPMSRINSMSTTGRITPRVLAGILNSVHVDEVTKEYIVKAVKNHEALLEAVKSSLKTLMYFHHNEGRLNENDWKMLHRTEDIARVAIAEARS